MTGGGDVKVATVTSENLDTMATLPISVSRYSHQQHAEKDASAIASQAKEQEANASKPHYVYHQIKRTSMFVVLSLLYGKLVIVACIAFVVSKEITKSLPVQYYEGFFTFLFGVSIVFLMYLFCFLLQDSSCCPGNGKKTAKKTKKAAKGSKNKEKGKKEAAAESASSQTSRNRPNILQGIGTKKKGKNISPTEEKLTEPSPDSIDIEASSPELEFRKRKTSQNLHHYGSFFLRVGAIGFGLGTMIYIGLQFGRIFEIPLKSPCYELLQSLNPILQMIFTFMQMYFIFMNARLKIHRFKFIARFGLMHVMATNICVWIKTLVYECLNGFSRKSPSYFNFTRGIVDKLTEEYNSEIGGKNILHIAKTNPKNAARALNQVAEAVTTTAKTLYEQMKSDARQVSYDLLDATTTTTTTSKTTLKSTSVPTTTVLSSTLKQYAVTPEIITSISTSTTTQASLTSTIANVFTKNISSGNFTTGALSQSSEKLNVFSPVAEALISLKQNVTGAYRNDSCGRMNIMGTIVEDSAPFLYPFVIEYSLIGAAVIFVMWRHIGRSPRYVSEENIEHKLEAILSQRAVAIAQAQSGSRVDCIGASKGLFFGLLLLVGSLICMLLFFVLIHHDQFSWLAVYLADASHSTVMALSILAIIIGFCRAKNLKFYAADTTDLNDILLRVSAFGLFVYAAFSIIAGARYALMREQNLLVLVNGTVTIFQVVLQLLFIGDMSKRHVYLPEHDRNKPGRQIVTFLLICNITMWILFTFESQKVLANPVQLQFFGDKAWKLVEHLTLPLCIFHRFHSAVALAEIWKNSYKPRIE